MKEKNISNIIRDNMFDYSAYVDLDRAIPSVESGLKPSLERILWTMYEGKNFKFTKSMDVEGATSKIHPHSGTYPTIVNMVQTDKQNIPLLTGQGNFGNHTSKELQPAASRYTKVKLSDIALDTLKGIDQNLVEFTNSYDGKKKIPEYIPTKFPLILCYASKGIGVGMGSNIPSFNLKELCEATIKYIDTKEETILVPDFATKGYIIDNEKEFVSINNTGKGTIRLRSNYIFKQDENVIEITQIPYSTTREEIIDKVIELMKEGKLKEVNDIKDASGFNGQKIKITCKRNTNMSLLMEKLYKLTPLESTFSSNINVLVDRHPKTIGVWEVVDSWLNFRRKCIVRKMKFELVEMKKSLHILEGLEKVLTDLEECINVIRFTDDGLLKGTLMKKFNIDEEQFNFIIKMSIRNINKDYITKKISERKELDEKIKNLLVNVKDEDYINSIIKEELEYVIKKFSVPRNTKIIKVDKINIEDIIVEDYNLLLVATKQGYLKKIKLTSLRGAGEHKLKEEDYIVSEYNTTNKSDILVFTNKQNCYKLKTSNLADTKVSNLGLYLPSHLELEDGEEIIKIIPTLDYKEDILIAFTNGKVARITLDAYKTKYQRSKIIKALSNDPIVDIHLITEDKNSILKSSANRGLIFKSKDIDTKSSKTCKGVTVMKHKDIEVVKFKPVDDCKISSIMYYTGGKAGKKLSIFDVI